MRASLRILSLALLVTNCGAPREPEGNAEPDIEAEPATHWFREEAAERGLDFQRDVGHRENYLFPGSVSGGAALVDVDGDGDLDAYLLQGGLLAAEPATRPPNRLYLNDGTGHFAEATEGSGTADRGYGMGVACGDYDNDGDADLYVTNLGRNTLLRNDGAGRFTDVTDNAGVGDERWGASAGFTDLDRDGHLDLFVTNYIRWSVASDLDCYTASGEPDYCSPNHFSAPVDDVLYRNNGDGTFTDISNLAGISNKAGNGLGLTFGDFDDDGLLDIFVANDGMPDHLWLNQGDDTFREEALEVGVAVDIHGMSKAGMGVDTIDVDSDGDLDLLVGNMTGETDSFFRNEGGYFLDQTAGIALGVNSRYYTRFGLALVDFDHDGQPDLFQATGRVVLAGELWSDDPFAEPNLLMRGLPAGRFEMVEPQGGTAVPLLATSRAAAFGDVDGDLDIDILVANRSGPPHLLINMAPKLGRAIVFRLVTRSGRDALGASVTMWVDDTRIRRDVRTAFSYCACNDPRVHVATGEIGTVGDVRATWADGTEEGFGDFEVGRSIELIQGSGRNLL